MVIITAIAFWTTLILLLIGSFNFINKVKDGWKCLSIIGSALNRRPARIHQNLYDGAVKFGKIFTTKIIGSDIVVLNSVEMVHRAFSRDGNLYNYRPGLFVADRLGLLESISFRDFDRHHAFFRRVFSKNLHLCMNIQNEFKQNVSDELNNRLKEITDYDGKEFEVTDLVQRAVINIISLLLIGEKATDKDVISFQELISGEDFFLNTSTNALLSHLPILLNLPSYKRRMENVLNAKQSLQETYFRKLEEGQETVNRGFVTELLNDAKNKSQITEDMQKAIVITDMLSAGVLSTSVVLSNIILCLINHPEYQLKVQQELEQVVGSSRQLTIDDRRKCCFTEAVIMETMRYIPPSPFWLPHACKENVEFEGVQIKANSQIFANSWFIHHDTNIWGDSWQFRPERFLDKGGKMLSNDHIYMKSWIPFGIGRRKCPGRELAATMTFLYIATIFQKFSLTPAPGKCGSCDPRSDHFEIDHHIKSKPFYCCAHIRK